MKCPYHDCQKDYNESQWPPVSDGFLRDQHGSIHDKSTKNRIYIKTWECRFCDRYFHEVSVGNEVWVGPPEAPQWEEKGIKIEALAKYPVSKTTFRTKSVPKTVRDAFNEAERCRSVGSITGTGACLRKAVYELCDAQGAEGNDYREKIGNLPVKEEHKELLKQFKWLGDNVTKPGEEKYTPEMVDVSLEVLPSIIDGLYAQAEKEGDAAKMLAKARSINPDAQKDA